MPAAGGDGPLHIDWLGPDLFGDARPGRLGMTILPGKHGASIRYPGRVYRRDLEADLGALAAAGAHILILLVEDHELARWGDADIEERARARGIHVVRVPIPDGHAPDASVMDRIVAHVVSRRSVGDVAVACMGGVGRTGLVAACALVAAGMAPDAAVATVRDVRHPQAVETPAQHAFVSRYATRLESRRVGG